MYIIYIYLFILIYSMLHSQDYEECATLDYFSAMDNEVCYDGCKVRGKKV